MSEGRQDPRVIAARIRAGAEALIRLTDAYSAIDPLDTAEEERRRIEEADRLVQEALDMFSGG